MLFNVEIINHATPALSVVNADDGAAVTYSQIKQSLGQQIYNVEGIYIYSENLNQLATPIQYQRYNSDGTQYFQSIVTAIDPYAANAISLNIDTTKYDQPFIFNGNSSFQADILPGTSVQVKFYSTRITNSFGKNLDNFKAIEIAANKPNFYDNLGDTIDNIQKTDIPIEQSASLGDIATPIKKPNQPININKIMPEVDCNVPVVFLGLAAVSLGMYLFTKDKIKN
jgi:VCBS repeat-containing protein